MCGRFYVLGQILICACLLILPPLCLADSNDPDTRSELTWAEIVQQAPLWGERWTAHSLARATGVPHATARERLNDLDADDPEISKHYNANSDLLSRNRRSQYYQFAVTEWNEVLAPIGSQRAPVAPQVLWDFVLDHSHEKDTAYIVGFGLHFLKSRVRTLDALAALPGAAALFEAFFKEKFPQANQKMIFERARAFAHTLRLFEFHPDVLPAAEVLFEPELSKRHRPNANPRPYGYHLIDAENERSDPKDLVLPQVQSCIEFALTHAEAIRLDYIHRLPGAEKAPGNYIDMKKFHETHRDTVRCLHQIIHAENAQEKLGGTRDEIWNFLFYANYPLAQYFVRKRLRLFGLYSVVLPDELDGEVHDALRRAMNRFNPFREKEDGDLVRFGSLLYLCIKSELGTLGSHLRGLSVSDHYVRMQSTVQRVALKIAGAERSTDQVTNEEIAKFLGTNENEIARYRTIPKSYSWGPKDRNPSEIDPPNETRAMATYEELVPYFMHLSLRRRLLLMLRYGIFSLRDHDEGYRLEELGGLFGLTRERIRQILEDAEEDLQQGVATGFRDADSNFWKLETEVILVELGVSPIERIETGGLEIQTHFFQVLSLIKPELLKRLYATQSQPYPGPAGSESLVATLRESAGVFPIGVDLKQQPVYPVGIPQGTWTAPVQCESTRCFVTHNEDFRTLHDERAKTVRFSILSADQIETAIPLARYMLPGRWQLILQAEELDAQGERLRIRHFPLGEPAGFSHGFKLGIGPVLQSLLTATVQDRAHLQRVLGRTPRELRTFFWQDPHFGSVHADVLTGPETRRLLNEIAALHHSRHRVNQRPFTIDNDKPYIVLECADGALVLELLPKSGRLFSVAGRFSSAERRFSDTFDGEDTLVEGFIDAFQAGDDKDAYREMLEILQRAIEKRPDDTIRSNGVVTITSRKYQWAASMVLGKERAGQPTTLSLISGRDLAQQRPWYRYLLRSQLRFGWNEVLVRAALVGGENRYYRILPPSERTSNNVLQPLPLDMPTYIGQLFVDRGQLENLLFRNNLPPETDYVVDKRQVVRLGGFRRADNPLPVPIKISVKEPPGSLVEVRIALGGELKKTFALPYWPGAEDHCFILVTGVSGTHYVFTLDVDQNKTINFLNLVFRKDTTSDAASNLYLGNQADLAMASQNTDDASAAAFALQCAIGDGLAAKLTKDGKKQVFLRGKYRAVADFGDEHGGKNAHLSLVPISDVITAHPDRTWLLRQRVPKDGSQEVVKGELESGESFYWTIDEDARNPMQLIPSDFYSYLGQILLLQSHSDPDLLASPRMHGRVPYKPNGTRVASFKAPPRKTVAAKITLAAPKDSELLLYVRTGEELKSLYPTLVWEGNDEEAFLAVENIQNEIIVFSLRLDPAKSLNTINLVPLVRLKGTDIELLQDPNFNPFEREELKQDPAFKPFLKEQILAAESTSLPIPQLGVFRYRLSQGGNFTLLKEKSFSASGGFSNVKPYAIASFTFSTWEAYLAQHPWMRVLSSDPPKPPNEVLLIGSVGAGDNRYAEAWEITGPTETKLGNRLQPLRYSFGDFLVHMVQGQQQRTTEFQAHLPPPTLFTVKDKSVSFGSFEQGARRVRVSLTNELEREIVEVSLAHGNDIAQTVPLPETILDPTSLYLLVRGTGATQKTFIYDLDVDPQEVVASLSLPLLHSYREDDPASHHLSALDFIRTAVQDIDSHSAETPLPPLAPFERTVDGGGRIRLFRIEEDARVLVEARATVGKALYGKQAMVNVVSLEQFRAEHPDIPVSDVPFVITVTTPDGSGSLHLSAWRLLAPEERASMNCLARIGASVQESPTGETKAVKPKVPKTVTTAPATKTPPAPVTVAPKESVPTPLETVPLAGHIAGITAGTVELAMAMARETEKAATARYLLEGFRRLPRENRGHFVDLGAGDGALSASIAAEFSQTTLVERMESQQPVLHSRNIQNVTIFEGDYFDFLWGRESRGQMYDAILFAQSLYGDSNGRRKIIRTALARLESNGLMAIVTNNHSNQPGTISSIKRALGAEIFHEPNQDIVAKLVKRDPELYSVEVPIPVVHRTQTTFEMVAVLMSYLPASVRDNEQDVWKIAETLELPDGGYELFDDQTLIWISANPFLINGLKTPNCAHALTSAAEQY